MWILRRASNPLKVQASSIAASQFCLPPSYKTASVFLGDRAEVSEPTCVISASCLCFKNSYHSTSTPSNSNLWIHRFSSQADRKSSNEQDHLDDEFSTLGTLVDADVAQVNPYAEFSEDEEEYRNLGGSSKNEMEVSDTEVDVNKNNLKSVPSELFMAIVSDSARSVNHVIENWVEEGKILTGEEFSLAMTDFRKRRMYKRALQLSDCIEKSEHLDFVERDYACHLDLIAKVQGLYKAEVYINQIPESFRGEIVYRTLLANCVASGNEKKSEEIFNTMRKLRFPLTAFACNQLILLYKRLKQKKIADVLLLMEKENVKPSLFTYKILIDIKGQSNDITAIDQIVQTMKVEGIEPDLHMQAIIAKHYISVGCREKAEAIVKDMEGGNIVENRHALRHLLPLYAALGKSDEVGRLWEVCQTNPGLPQCIAAIEAWGRLEKIDEAEAAFERMLKTGKKLSSWHYGRLLKVYANQKMLAKGECLMKRMADNGCRIEPTTTDALVRLYVDAGDLARANSWLQVGIHQVLARPLLCSYMLIMEQYAKRGDIHNCERIFNWIRQAGYMMRLRQFQHLVEAYLNAKAPAYGMQDRMRADNVIPNNYLAGKLAVIDPFRKTAASYLLD